mgnify:CR=1 FL=1
MPTLFATCPFMPTHAARAFDVRLLSEPVDPSEPDRYTSIERIADNAPAGASAPATDRIVILASDPPVVSEAPILLALRLTTDPLAVIDPVR